MTRVLSGAVLFILAIASVWLAPSFLFLLIAESLVVLGSLEYARLAQHGATRVPVAVSTGAAVLTCAAVAGTLAAGPWASLEAALMFALVATGVSQLALWRGKPDAVGLSAATLFPALYLGLPIGAMIALREFRGREVLFLLMLTISASDTAQYYTGRALGRRPLAPTISPKKTVEGALGGFVLGSLVMVVAGAWWLPEVHAGLRAALGVAIVAIGIVGDLFESILKRSAGAKDSARLIPGHGGVLDRIDALLFAAPVYYVVLRYV